MARKTVQVIGDPSYLPFKNFAKNSVSYGGLATDTVLWTTLIDKNGYPTASLVGMSSIAFTSQVSRSYTGNWVISFTGAGELVILAASTTVLDQDSCVVAAGGNTQIRSNTASEARGITRVVVKFTTPTSAYAMAFPGGSTKFSNVGGAAPNQVSSMQNLVFCRCSAPYGNGGATASGDEVDIASGDLSRMFNDECINVFAALSPKILRNLGFGDINRCNVSQHSTRPPIAAVTYMGARFDPTLVAGDTSGTDAYTCSAAPGTSGAFVDGEQVQVRFKTAQQADKPVLSAVLTGGTSIAITVTDATGISTGQKIFAYLPGLTDTATTLAGLAGTYTASVSGNVVTITGTFSGAYTSGGSISRQPTIDVGGRGARPILSDIAFSPNSTFPAGLTIAIGANSLATLTYNGVLGSWIYRPGGLAGTTGYYAPFEMCVAFCNKLGCDYWHEFPTYMTTASAVAQATYIRDNLTSGSTAYFEWGNEIWNPTFAQNWTTTGCGRALNFPASSARQLYGWWSYRYAEIMKAIGLMWSGGVALKRVIAFQGVAGSEVDSFLFTGSLLNSSQAGYWAFNPVDYSVVGNRPIDFCEAISYGNYYFGPQVGQFDADYISAGVIPARNVAFYAGLTAAADAFAAGDTSQIAFVDNDVRYGTTPPATVTMAADGTITVGSGTCASNGVDGPGRRMQFFVSGGSLPSPLIARDKVYYVSGTPTSTTFKVSATNGGAAITSLTGGSGTFSFGLTHQNLLVWNSERRDFWNAYAATYNKDVLLYESASSPWFPSVAACTTIGLTTPSAAVASQRILDLVIAWQASTLSLQTSYDQMTGFMQASKSASPSQLQLPGVNAWAMLRGFDTPVSGNANTFKGDITGLPNGSFDATRLFNTGKRRMTLKYG